jgi:HAD superfamily hydrolase (TIGR01509 family)
VFAEKSHANTCWYFYGPYFRQLVCLLTAIWRGNKFNLENMGRKIRVVVFDLGGVLVRINRSWQEAASCAGIALAHPPADFDDLECFREYQAGLSSVERYTLELAHAFQISPEEALRLHQAILRDPYPGTLEIVQEVQAKGHLTACLSNTNALHWNVLTDPERFPAICLLRHKIASQVVALAKPEEPIYRLMEETVKAKGEEILFFEDSPANVATAVALGWQAIRIDHDADPAAQMRQALVARGVL